MFGMFQRRDQGSAAHSGNFLVSFVSMNHGGRGLNAREKLAVAHRVETVPPLDNPLSALAISPLASDGVPAISLPSVSAPAVLLPVSTSAMQSTSAQPDPRAGGLTW
jgi:hypothetical protein